MKKPFSTVDIAIFTVVNEILKVLLVKRHRNPSEPYPDYWALPGGYIDIDRDESLEATAFRKLQEKTGVIAPYLEQVGGFGDNKRDPRGWTVTHLYFSLLPWQEVKALQETNIAETQWFNIKEIINLDFAFDHRFLLDIALERLRSKVEYTSLPAYLLTEPFTLPQLQKVYEIVLDRPVDKSGFRTRMLAVDFLEEAGLLASNTPRAPMGYRIIDRDNLIVFPRTFNPRS